MFFRSLFALLVFSATGLGQTIRLPSVSSEPPPPLPMPASSVLKLSSEVYYVVEADVPVMILASPDGIVNVGSDTGPLKLRGKFIDGKGKVETRTYKGKYVYYIDQNGTASGNVELFVFAVGEPDASKVQRVKLIVGEVQPIPPPVVPPVVVPPVVPPAPVLTPFQSKLQAAYKLDAVPASSVAKYAALFKTAATVMVKDQTLNTGADLLKEMQVAVKGLGIPAGSMHNTAVAVEAELNSFISKNGTLDQSSRDNISALFARVATDLLTAGGQ
jgi:hypothetical protein